MNRITESTLIPISLVVLIIGGITWLTNMHSKVQASAEKAPVIEKIAVDIEVIKTKMEIVEKKLDKLGER